MSPDRHSRLASPRHETSPHLAAAPHTHPHPTPHSTARTTPYHAPHPTPHTPARTHAAPSIASQPALPARGRGLTTRGLCSGWWRTVGVATPHLAAHIPKHRGRPCTGAMAAPHNLPRPLAPRAPNLAPLTLTLSPTVTLTLIRMCRRGGDAYHYWLPSRAAVGLT